jgi:type II secretory pathway pseudopilin PulG
VQAAFEKEHGFAAIELVAVLAVTLIVGALGVSVYQTYSVRAEIASTLALTADLQRRVASYFKSHAEPPADRDAAKVSSVDVAALGPFVESVDIVDGRIELHFGGDADPAISGRSLSLTPFETVEQDVVWVCGNKIAGRGLEPLGFAGGVRQASQVLTPIDARYLPSACR